MQDRRGIKKKFYAKYTFAKHCNLVVLRKAELRITCSDLSIYSTRRTSNWYLRIKNGECCPGTKFPKCASRINGMRSTLWSNTSSV